VPVLQRVVYHDMVQKRCENECVCSGGCGGDRIALPRCRMRGLCVLLIWSAQTAVCVMLRMSGVNVLG